MAIHREVTSARAGAPPAGSHGDPFMAGGVGSWLAQPATEREGDRVTLAGPRGKSARRPQSGGPPPASRCPDRNGDPRPTGRWVPQGKPIGRGSGRRARFPPPSYLLTTSYHFAKMTLQLRKQRLLAAPMVTDSRQPQGRRPATSFPTAESHMPAAHRPLRELRDIRSRLDAPTRPPPPRRCRAPSASGTRPFHSCGLSSTRSENQRNRPSVGSAPRSPRGSRRPSRWPRLLSSMRTRDTEHPGSGVGSARTHVKHAGCVWAAIQTVGFTGKSQGVPLWKGRSPARPPPPRAWGAGGRGKDRCWGEGRVDPDW